MSYAINVTNLSQEALCLLLMPLLVSAMFLLYSILSLASLKLIICLVIWS